MRLIVLLCLCLWSLFFLLSDVYADVDDGLLAYYSFQGNANDESGHGNNGIVNGAKLTQDRFGVEERAYYFDGVDDYINIGDKLKPPFPITISLWLNPDKLFSNIQRAACFFSNDTIDHSSYRYGVGLYVHDGVLHTSYYEGYSSGNNRVTYESNEKVIFSGQWQHVVVKFSAHRDVQIYVNGAEKSGYFYEDGTGSGLSYSSKGNGTIGGNMKTSKGRSYYNGKIDDIRLYNRALSEMEIKELKNKKPFPSLSDDLELKIPCLVIARDCYKLHLNYIGSIPSDLNGHYWEIKPETFMRGKCLDCNYIRLKENLDLDISTLSFQDYFFSLGFNFVIPDSTNYDFLWKIDLDSLSQLVKPQSFEQANPPEPPVAQISAHKYSGPAPFQAELDGSGSYDPDGYIIEYLWRIGDGRTASTPMATFVFETAGVYQVTLTVTDNEGHQDSTTKTIAVTAAQPDVIDLTGIWSYTGWFTTSCTKKEIGTLTVKYQSGYVDGTIYSSNGLEANCVYSGPYSLSGRYAGPPKMSENELGSVWNQMSGYSNVTAEFISQNKFVLTGIWQGQPFKATFAK